VHSTTLYPNLLGVLAGRLAGTPAIVASVRDMGGLCGVGLQRLQRLTCRLADAVVTNAEAVAGRLRAEGWDGARIEVINNGFVPPAAPPDAAAGPGIRDELGIPPGAPVVGAVCRLHPVKRLGDLLEAAALLAPRHPEARVVIVGPLTGSPVFEACARELRRLAARLGLGRRVILTGARTDVPRILAELTVSVLPSESEGLSNTLLESMAAGVPVVATAVGGTPEVVEDGISGLLVPPADPASLAAAIGCLLEAPRMAAAIGAAGRRRVADRFGLERMVEATTRLYQRLLARPHGARRRLPALGRMGSAP
jgi:glycosyltransferase involved in cell wall biosynthesis